MRSRTLALEMHPWLVDDLGLGAFVVGAEVGGLLVLGVGLKLFAVAVVF